MNMMTAAPARLLATGLLSFGLTGGVAAVSAPAAQAAPAAQTTASVASVSTSVSAATARSAVRVAASKKGKPYRWGASGPNAFDCSGLTQMAWKASGVDIPKYSRDQYTQGGSGGREQAPGPVAQRPRKRLELTLDDVVRVAQAREDGVTLEQIAADFGIHPMTLQKWIRKADVEAGIKPGTTSAESRPA